MEFCLKGEDRTFGGDDLFVDLIPSTSWFSNARSCIRARDWDILRKEVYKRVNNKCECCQYDPSGKGSLEAHERWHYNNRTGVQKLMRLIALCKMCHTATHIALADMRGVGDMARAHLMRVTGMDKSDMEDHCERASGIWSDRSNKEWTLDLSIITDSGFRLRDSNKENIEKCVSIKEPIASENKNDSFMLEQERSANYISRHRNTTNNEMVYHIELTVNRHLDKTAGHWWLRKFRDPNDTLPGEPDKRMPRISAHKRLHISCNLAKGRYMVGCGDMFDLSIVQCFSIHENNQIDFE